MKPATLSTALLLIGLALAPWFGGHVLFDAAPMSGFDFWYSAFVSRTNPAVNHALVATFILLAVAIAAFRRNVLQVPGPLIAGLLFFWWIWIGISVMGSRFKHDSILEMARYTSYLLTLFACVLLLGRGKLARSALIAIFVGTAFVALSGLNEFMMSMRVAPDWRIFAGWQNPNAVAGLFAIVLPVGIALALSSKQGAERTLFILGSSLVCVALWLTASKGGLLAAVIGILALAAFGAAHRLLDRRHVAALGSVIVLAAILVVGISSLASAVGEKSAPGGRLMAAGQEAEQSVGFRQQLWKDTLKMAQANPAFGSGAGTYGEEIQNFTATEGSVIAHNSYLQMAAESGFPASILLLLIAVVWLVAVLRRHEGLPAEMNLLRVGIAAGVVAAGANLVVESSLSYFGFSTVLFAFLGIGMLLAVDGVAPERAPLLSRALGGGLISLAALYYLVVVAVSQYQMSEGLYALQEGRIEAGERRLRTAVSATPLASQPHAELSRVHVAMRRPEEAVASARRAADLAPTPKHFLMLGEAYEASGKLEEARQAYATAAEEYKSSYTLRRYLDFLVEHGRMADAEAAARDLIAVSKAEGAAVSALPWLVGTDAVDAHIFLANRAGGRDDKETEIAMLSGARDILKEYESKTLPELVRVTGLRQVEEDREALSKKLGREATDADVAQEWGMTLEELQQFVERARSFKLAGESVDGADKLVNIRKKIEIRLDSIQRAAS